MKWVKVDDFHVRSEPPGFTVARFNMGPNIALVAFQGMRAIHVERGIGRHDDDARRAAAARCAEVCREAAAGE